ncbi:hypothetical protein F5146DRAFT_1005694 [Armillaria mellea]|nr:hypothetical protein F5146DRAFT_1005694 [Armillaria mellea]
MSRHFSLRQHRLSKRRLLLRETFFISESQQGLATLKAMELLPPLYPDPPPGRKRMDPPIPMSKKKIQFAASQYVEYCTGIKRGYARVLDESDDAEVKRCVLLGKGEGPSVWFPAATELVERVLRCGRTLILSKGALCLAEMDADVIVGLGLSHVGIKANLEGVSVMRLVRRSFARMWLWGNCRVKCYGFGYGDRDRPWILSLMEYIEARAISSLSRAHRGKIMHAVKVWHQLGYTHRDVSENIVWITDEDPVLVALGGSYARSNQASVSHRIIYHSKQWNTIQYLP